MINGKNTAFSIDGTSALKAQACPGANAASIILPFPGVLRDSPARGIGGMLDSVATRIRQRALEILESSEMYCSLRYEDYRGCRYGVFTKNGIAVLSLALSVVAVVSLVLGA